MIPTTVSAVNDISKRANHLYCRYCVILCSGKDLLAKGWRQTLCIYKTVFVMR